MKTRKSVAGGRYATALLLAAYTEERADERQFWAVTTSLVLAFVTAGVGALALVPSRLWLIWAIAPFVSPGFFCYWAQQSSIGSRRRYYMDALERALSGPQQIRVEGVDVRLLNFNRYTLSMNAWEHEYASWPARGLWLLSIGTVAGLAYSIPAISAIQLTLNGRPLIAGLSALLGSLFLSLIFGLGLATMTPRSRMSTWTFAQPNKQMVGSERSTHEDGTLGPLEYDRFRARGLAHAGGRIVKCGTLRREPHDPTEHTPGC